MIIKKINAQFDRIYLFFEGESPLHAWLENVNKHLPDIFEVFIDQEKHCLFFNTDKINTCFERSLELKLSICNEFERMEYECCFPAIRTIKISSDFFCTLRKRAQGLFFLFKKGQENNLKNVLVFGSCFSRCIFRAEPYFNLEYKNFFKVDYTVFHNSLISMMSCPIKDSDYSKIKDLNRKDVFEHIELEFKKNIIEIIENLSLDCIVFDNYMDATTPLVKISETQYLTYNKYFSESIYKHKFVGCPIIYPGTMEYEKLYRNAVKKFFFEINRLQPSCKMILIGCRLSRYYLDVATGEKRLWNNKLDWIESSNENWDVLDEIFIKEYPSSEYIDLKGTCWISDLNTPIVGGASPSHLQSEFYREVFCKIKYIMGMKI